MNAPCRSSAGSGAGEAGWVRRVASSVRSSVASGLWLCPLRMAGRSGWRGHLAVLAAASLLLTAGPLFVRPGAGAGSWARLLPGPMVMSGLALLLGERVSSLVAGWPIRHTSLRHSWWARHPLVLLSAAGAVHLFSAVSGETAVLVGGEVGGGVAAAGVVLLALTGVPFWLGLFWLPRLLAAGARARGAPTALADRWWRRAVRLKWWCGRRAARLCRSVRAARSLVAHLRGHEAHDR